MENLIAALEASEGPSQELDMRIYNAIYPDGADYVDPKEPRYTSSLDAAITLIPTGWRVEEWFIGADKSSCIELDFFPKEGHIPTANGSHECSAAIALCIASLRAREKIIS